MITIPSAIYVQIIKRIEHLESHVEALEKFQVLHLLKRLEKLELEKMEVSAAGSAAGGSAAPVEPVLAAAEEPPSKKARLQSAETLDDDALKMLDAVKEVAVAEVAVAEDAKWSVWNEAKRQALKMLVREGVTIAERGPMRKGTMWYGKTKILHEQMMKKMGGGGGMFGQNTGGGMLGQNTLFGQNTGSGLFGQNTGESRRIVPPTRG